MMKIILMLIVFIFSDHMFLMMVTMTSIMVTSTMISMMVTMITIPISPDKVWQGMVKA